MASALEKALDRTNAYIARLQERAKKLEERLERQKARAAKNGGAVAA